MLFIGKKPLKSWKVKSRSQRNPDTEELLEYSVEFWADKAFFCECKGFKWSKKKKPCYHVQEKQEELIGQFGDLDEAVKHFEEEKNKKQYLVYE